jgi:O-antigen ligase
VGLSFAAPTPAVRPRILVLPGIALCAAAIFQGGSRGSMLVLLIGLWLFTLGGRSLGQWIRSSLIIAVGVIALFAAALQSPLVRARWEKAQSGNLSGREEIFPAAWSMVVERPLTGWGPTANKYELASRVPQQGYARRDTHNLGLELLTSTGVAGFVPFAGALLLCLRSAWTARRGPRGILPFALTASLLAGNMAANHLTFRLQWLALAYAVASAAPSRVPSGATAGGRRRQRVLSTASPQL